MKTFANYFLIIILIAIIYIYFESQSYEVTYVTSKVDGRRYLVRNLPDKQKAADMIATISQRLQKVVNYLDKANTTNIYYKFLKKGKKDATKDAPLIEKLGEDIDRLVKNYDPDALSESTPDAKFTSYSVNKGEKVFFCLRARNKEEEKLEKLNTMMFVALHELGHLMTKEIGHVPTFWANFKFLIKIAIHLNVYKFTDFNKKPEEYCGVDITDTPYKGD